MRRCLQIVSLLVVAGGLTLFACAQQGEGEVCYISSAGQVADDCAAGLTCTGPSLLNPPPSDSDKTHGRCCPSDRAQATVSVCLQQNTPAAADPSTPASQLDGGVDSASPDASAADTGTPDTSTPDASASDSGTD